MMNISQAAAESGLSAKQIRDYEKAAALQQRAEAVENELMEKLERWEELEAKQNGAG